MTTERALSLIRLVSLFHGASEADVLTLARHGQFRQLRRTEALFHEGDRADALYAVESGWLKIFKLSPRGNREVTLYLEGPRQVVAGVSALIEDARLAASCVALEDACVLCLPADVVRHVTFHSPTVAQAVIGYFARRQGDLLHRMEQLLFSDLSERLAAHLLASGAHSPYALPTNSELASLLGTVPELVSRKLGEFYRQGFITLSRRTVRILDVEALRALAEGESRAR
ncbi:Crp/Fnr family transcriptional regulator [Deinococcus peraridilitoris]|uniref:cAMP-binding protein n=1 Tax=Deinococcus peraridilitoris (strain DSM 19664 / LMG 22246 / CIP 109416 / KR-200) TaxID=937777 RepID=L0A606_DEIPD|nr:Crp/Fnr family transcriptional regulator [Deinococcus peraridilitoris]AFZ68455.1 cAMP-binding protein [Deinococcus peraridilitoris DSM 19664]